MAERTRSDHQAIVGICLYPGVWESSASLARDLVHLASVIAHARTGRAGIEGRLLGARRGDVPTASGTTMHAPEGWNGVDVDVIVLPSLAVPFLEPDRRPPGLASWIVRQWRRGCLVVATGTGSWLLAETGLLDGHAATTHWSCVDRCRRQYPAVDWTGEQRLAVAGGLVTAQDLGASATALCHAIGRVLDVSIAERAYQYSLIHETGSASLPLIHTIGLRDHGDAQIVQVQEFLETRFGEPISATDAALLVHLSPRQLRRRFAQATGLTLSAYLTDVRLARARELLLSTDEATSRIANRVGYADASTFTALFKKHHGLTPSAYRVTSDGAIA